MSRLKNSPLPASTSQTSDTKFIFTPFMWSSVIFNTIGTVLHHLKIKLPTAYSTEAEASDTSVASILHHDLLNCEEPVTVWSPSTKSTVS